MKNWPEEFSFDCCPRTLLECVVDRKIQTRRYLEYKKRSHKVLSKQVTDLLFSRRETEDKENAELLHEEELHIQRRIRNQWPKKRRKQKEVVMFTDRATGLQSCLLPKMSIWYNHRVVLCSSHCFLLDIYRYNMFVESPNLENPRFHKLFHGRCCLTYKCFQELHQMLENCPLFDVVVVVETMRTTLDLTPLSTTDKGLVTTATQYSLPIRSVLTQFLLNSFRCAKCLFLLVTRYNRDLSS